MPEIDPSIALSSPMLVDGFVAQRRPSPVNTDGRARPYVAAAYQAYGIVHVIGPSSLERRPDEQHAQKTIQVITPFRLQGPTEGFQPDLVIWHGDTYIVNSVEDYSNLGPGWVLAVAGSWDSVEAPPQPLVQQTALTGSGLVLGGGTQIIEP